MKKNIFLSMLATTLLLATSCSQTDELLQPTPAEGTVTFTAHMNNGSMNLRSESTRATTDAKDETITRAVLEIYDADGAIVGTRIEGTIAENETITFSNLKLESGVTYTCYFWADCGEGVDDTDVYDISNLKAIARGSNPSIAYYAKEEITADELAPNMDVILTHAVAKVALVETGTLNEGDEVGISFTIPEYTFNVATGECTAGDDDAIEEIVETFTIEEGDPTGGQIGSLYLFTPIAGADLVTMTLSVTAAKEEGEEEELSGTKEISSVPLKINHRTIIRGKFREIATIATQIFSVTLDEDWIDMNSVYIFAKGERDRLLAWAKAYNEGKKEDFTLQCDVDLTDFLWTPVGSEESPFQHTFDGGGFDMRMVKVSSDDFNSAGLFSHAGANAVIKNIRLTPFIEGTADHLGGIVGRSFGCTISNCEIFSGFLGSNGNTGGIVGTCEEATTIDKCRVIELYVEEGDNLTAGGIAGSFLGSMTNCVAETFIRSAVIQGVLIGECQEGSIIQNCHWNEGKLTEFPIGIDNRLEPDNGTGCINFQVTWPILPPTIEDIMKDPLEYERFPD